MSAGETPYVPINHPLDHGSLLINVRTSLPNVLYDPVIADTTFGFDDPAMVIILVAVLIAIFWLLSNAPFPLVIFVIDKVV